MEIWLDTTHSATIAHASKLGILHGITTNPSLVAKSGKSLEDLLEQLLDLQDGPVAIQVVADEPKEIIRQAELLTAHSPRVIVKVPISEAGILTIHQLTSQNIPVMATTLFEPRQALLAFKAGAHYLAPYIGRIDDMGLDSSEILYMLHEIKNNYHFEGKIIAAGIRAIETVTFALEVGIDAITLNDDLYQKLIQEPEGTKQALSRFQEDWKKAKQSELLSNQ